MNKFLYRGQIKGSKEFVIGWLFWDKFIMKDKEYFEQIYFDEHFDGRFDFGSGNINCEFYEIEEDTLSIHLSQMIDRNNKKLFAAINGEKGGDNVLLPINGSNNYLPIIFKNMEVYIGNHTYKSFKQFEFLNINID